jgi:HEAT repeat protein
VNTTLKTLLRQAREDAEPTARREAILAIGRERDPGAFRALAGFLRDPSPDIQRAAILGFARIGDPEAVPLLTRPRVMRSPSTDVRWAAVSAVGRIGGLDAVEPLVRASEDEEWVVRDQAVNDLKRILAETRGGEPRTARLLTGLLDVDHPEIVEAAVEAIAASGERLLEPLIRSLPHHRSSPVWRANAARALGRIGNPRAVPFLVRLLGDPDGRVRRSAVEALGRTGDERSAGAVLAALEDIQTEVQREAVGALTRFGVRSTDPIHHALRHAHNKYVLRAMIATLGEIGDVRSVPEIVRYVGSTYFVVRAAAVKALVKFGERAIPELTAVLDFNRSDVRPLLADAEKALKKRTGGCFPPECLRAIRALAALEDHRAIDVLKRIAAAGGAETAVEAERALFRIGTAAWQRCSALVCLREIGHPSALPHVMRSLDDPSSNVRLEAVRALGRVPGPGRPARLARIATAEADPYLRAEALEVLRQTGESGPLLVRSAIRCLGDADPDVRAQAAGLLGNLRDRSAVTALMRALDDRHWTVQESAENALHNFGKDAASGLKRGLKDRSPRVRFRSARLAGELGDRGFAPLLERIAGKKGEDPEAARAAADAAEKIRLRTSAGGRAV